MRTILSVSSPIHSIAAIAQTSNFVPAETRALMHSVGGDYDQISAAMDVFRHVVGIGTTSLMNQPTRETGIQPRLATLTYAIQGATIASEKRFSRVVSDLYPDPQDKEVIAGFFGHTTSLINGALVATGASPLVLEAPLLEVKDPRAIATDYLEIAFADYWERIKDGEPAYLYGQATYDEIIEKETEALDVEFEDLARAKAEAVIEELGASNAS